MINVSDFCVSGCLKRVLWTLLTVGLVAVWLWNSYSVLTSFLNYDVTVSFDIRLAHEVKFPAVTICNQNLARSSKMNSDPKGAALLEMELHDSGRRHSLNYLDLCQTQIMAKSISNIIIIIYKTYIAPYIICTEIALRRFTNIMKCKIVLLTLKSLVYYINKDGHEAKPLR